jgi:hypothetical protein
VFHAESKCCTYHPTLPNFLVGRILRDDDPDPAAVAGRETVRRRLASGVGVTPLGIAAPPWFMERYEDDDRRAFGRDVELRCPHYLHEAGGLCGIWRNRSAVCATWFCRYERGARGHASWRAIERALHTAERDLAMWCVVQRELGDRALEHLFPPPPTDGTSQPPGLPQREDGTFAPEVRAAIWGPWVDREAEFFQACAGLLDGMTWNDVERACGPEVAVRARLAAAAFRRLATDPMDEPLVPGRFEVVEETDAAVLAVGYSKYDPLRLPKKLLNVLPRFDGRPAREVAAEIARTEGLRLGPALIRRLADQEVLRPRPPGS